MIPQIHKNSTTLGTVAEGFRKGRQRVDSLDDGANPVYAQPGSRRG
ncbi:MAG: hypothetical protein QF922_11590 [SAR324 cluster bacterium]|nr:hypothetical protein [SAR324 cluster bacterium]